MWHDAAGAPTPSVEAMKRPIGVPLVVIGAGLAMAILVVGYYWRRRGFASENKTAPTLREESLSTPVHRKERAEPGGNMAPAAPAVEGTAPLRTRVASILKLPKKADRDEALQELAAALARHHPAGASEVLRELIARGGEHSSDAYVFVSQFSSEYAQIDVAAAAAWIELLPLSLRFTAATFVAQQWSRADLAAATRWAGGIADQSLRLSILTRMGEELERNADVRAGSTWARLLATTPDAGGTSEIIARLWARGDITGAFQWSVAIEDPAARTAATTAVAAVVAKQAPEAAADWVGRFPAGGLRDQTVSAVAGIWADSNPAAAARWVESLGDQRLLENNIRLIAPRWLQADPDAAQAWIRRARISDETRRYLEALGRPTGN